MSSAIVKRGIASNYFYHLSIIYKKISIYIFFLLLPATRKNKRERQINNMDDIRKKKLERSIIDKNEKKREEEIYIHQHILQ